jgi:hypothetical protein
MFELEYAVNAEWWQKWCDYVNIEYKQFTTPKYEFDGDTTMHEKQTFKSQIELQCTYQDRSNFLILKYRC